MAATQDAITLYIQQTPPPPIAKKD